MSGQKRIGLYWFTRDLRLDDMPSLIKLNSVVDELLLVYHWHEVDIGKIQTPFTDAGAGPHRKRFIQQGLDDLSAQLIPLNQHIVCLSDRPERILPELCKRYQVTDIGITTLDGIYEQRRLEKIKQCVPAVIWHEETIETLFDVGSLPMAIEDVDNTFTPWRKKIEGKVSPLPPCEPVRSLKPPPKGIVVAQTAQPTGFLTKRWHGGERYGLAQLNYYFEQSENLSRYKETRNGMLGWDFSSKFSAWLANGMLSPRRVAERLNQYENHVQKNDSTYWLYFELLWREFFRLQLKKHGRFLFAAGGFKSHTPNMNFGEHDFALWRDGQTGCEIVDAGMRQLKQTGFMSNRARQLCASYLIHEMNQHWRHGAAYFEYMLIDYDVASNWGNWLYLAGGGSDPRGQRKFDIQAQTERYDPDRTFINRWLK